MNTQALKSLKALSKCLSDNGITLVKTAGNNHQLCISIHTKEGVNGFTDVVFEEEINSDMIDNYDYTI